MKKEIALASNKKTVSRIEQRCGSDGTSATTIPGAVHIVRFRRSNAIVRSNYAARRPGGLQARIVKKRFPAGPRCLTQRAGIASPHAEGDGLSGVTSDRETFAFISAPAGVVGGVPLTRARNPWAMPAAST